MQSSEFIWQNGELIPWNEAKTHVLAHGLHYGSGVFEGIRFYETDSGPAIFKLAEHVERLFYSARQLAVEIPYTQDEVSEAIIETVRVNKVKQGYIRPVVYYGYGSMRVIPTEDLPVEVVIACWPWGSYLGQESVDIKSSEFIRIHPRSTVADAKICGHYVNSIMAGLAIRNTHYHEVLLFDADAYVAEGSAENIFIVKNGELLTPEIGTILRGITRDTVIEIAKAQAIPVRQSKLRGEDVLQADEALFCGTGVEITPIRSLDDKLIADGKIGPITQNIQKTYQKIVTGRLDEYKKHLSMIEDKTHVR